MADSKRSEPSRLRQWVTVSFNWAEDAVYVGLGVLLAAVAITLLITESIYYVQYLAAGVLSENIVFLLDRILLIIIFVEVLYTVQVSFRQHILQPEPFLVVGMIAVTRRILVLTAEISKLVKDDEALFRNSMIELGLLTILIISLVVSLRLLSQRNRSS
ncbi:MAG TPA: phosphate-starvation-inducible PsiE family protein [Candidatus Udaeobacter sp.]|nr:phosphate-starvation-inducible PsiE family protein [Candidatus Udaeobacter sp.]